MRIDPCVHSLPSLNPFSWENSLSRRTTIEMEALPSGAASREKVLENLESLERQLSQLVGHAGKIMALQVAREGVIFSCATDNTVRMWDGDRPVSSPSVGGVR